MSRFWIVASVLAITATAVGVAHAFCGFYVAGTDTKMFADATNVILMRDGTRTVLSMQNDYRGPLEDFAMVVPVPVVLQEGDVKVLPKAVFDRLDSLGSPRLVEYWEQDPCPPPPPPPMAYRQRGAMRPSSAPSKMSVDMPSEMAAEPSMPAAPMREPKHVPPVLASFSVDLPAITADTATNVTWSFAYSNQPYPEPSCTIDHGVGNVYPGTASSLVLHESSTLTLTCANDAGRSTKTVKINVVKIEAKFDVAEYQILILSAKEATGLEQWLTLNKYKIPKQAEELLRPYIESGSKFFVAKVDPKKVQMIDGHAALSPLRFHYDSDEFTLPIRLGLANSSGKQDLIVNILSPDKRYELANYKNVMIPTNFDVKPSVKTRFAEFYAALFDKTIEANPRAVVTEYAWTSIPTPVYNQSYHCDPCPPVIPEDKDMMILGGDIIGGQINKGGYVLTRLHARYGKTDMKDDLRFREAKPIAGGRERYGKFGIEYGSVPSDQNFFQARYAIRYWWTGEIKCQNPQRAVWGPNPNGGGSQVIAASKIAFAPRGKLELGSVIKRDIWEIGYKRTAPPPAPPSPGKTSVAPAKGMWFGGGALAGLVFLQLATRIARRRRLSREA
jgi:hypothetical protein